MRKAALLMWAVGGGFIALGVTAELGRLISGPAAVALSPPASMLNPHVLRQIESYPQDGSHTYLPLDQVPTSMGITRDISYMGQLLWQGDDTKRAHCIGLVFEVYFGACEAYAAEQTGEPRFTLPGVDLYNVRAFQRDFYGVGGNERTLVEALVSRGLGQEITDPDLARPGDFIQMWAHSGWGHSAVFLGWVTDERGAKTGIHYWSVQREGLGEDTVPLTDDPHSVWIDPERVFIVRAALPELPPRQGEH